VNRGRAAAIGVAALLGAVPLVPTAAAVPPDTVFCTDKPKDRDITVATAVNAVQVGAGTTPPVAVVDTGLNPGTPELLGRTVSPFDALGGTESAPDLFGHGTQIAGIAAGATGGDGLVRGISPNSPVMPIAIYNRLGETSIDALVKGIRWATDHGAAAITVSNPIPAADLKPAELTALRRAVTDAFARGSIVVASAGNEGSGQADVPAVLPHVLTVGGSTTQGLRATFSNFAPWVDLVAPAAALVAPVGPGLCASGYATANGTAFAAPAVAGAVALISALRPGLTTQQRAELLRKSATDVDPTGWDQETGFGMLNVQKAATADPPPIETSPEVDDDPIYVRGANAGTHLTALTKTRTKKITGSLSPSKDPADVYPVRLKKGDRFVASASVTSGDGLVFLGLWKPSVGDYDVSSETTKQQVVTSGGFSPTPELKMRVKKTGTYYVSVEAQDPIDEDDPEDVAPASEPYKMTLSSKHLKTRPAPKKPAKRKKSKNG
jgi:Subtilase family